MTRRVAPIGLAVLLVALLAAPLRADVIGALLPKGTFELGLQERWMDRTQVNQASSFEWDQYDMSVVARWGVTEFATVSIEGMTGSGPWLSDHEGTQQFYLAGLAGQAVLWRGSGVIVSGTFGFSETVQRFEVESDHTIRLSSTDVAVAVQKDLPAGGHRFVLWAGPIFSYESVSYPRTPTRLKAEYVADSIFGGMLGLDMIFFQHVNLSGQLVWVERPEPRLSLLYRF